MDGVHHGQPKHQPSCSADPGDCANPSQSKADFDVHKSSTHTPEELYQIFELKVRLAGMGIDKNAVGPVKKIIDWGSSRKNFGNGRFIDKLFQNTLTKHATLNLPKKELLTIRKESVPTIEEIMQKFGRFMG